MILYMLCTWYHSTLTRLKVFPYLSSSLLSSYNILPHGYTKNVHILKLENIHGRPSQMTLLCYSHVGPLVHICRLYRHIFKNFRLQVGTELPQPCSSSRECLMLSGFWMLSGLCLLPMVPTHPGDNPHLESVIQAVWMGRVWDLFSPQTTKVSASSRGGCSTKKLLKGTQNCWRAAGD